MAVIDIEAGMKGTGRLQAVLENIGPGRETPPELVIKAILELGDRTNEGVLISAVAIPWFAIARMIQRDPQAILSISPREWEEIIAGAYTQAGFDEVILTREAAILGVT